MATRVYFDSAATPAVNPPFEAWTTTTGAVRVVGRFPKGSTALVTAGAVSVASGANNRGLALSVLIGPLASQTVTGTYTIVIDAIEGAGTDNINQRSASVRATDSTGTVTGTLKTFGVTGGATEIGTTFPYGCLVALNGSLTSTAIPANGYIVVEIGLGLSSTGTTPQFQVRYGETGTDHTTTEGDTTGSVGWVEFSANLTAAPAVIYPTILMAQPVSG